MVHSGSALVHDWQRARLHIPTRISYRTYQSDQRIWLRGMGFTAQCDTTGRKEGMSLHMPSNATKRNAVLSPQKRGGG